MTTSSMENQFYKALKKLDEIGIESDKLIELFDRELENMQGSINKLHEEANEETKNIEPLFENRVFDMLKKLCKLELLKIVKETFELTKHDIKAIGKVAKQDRFSMNIQDIHYLQKIAEKFTEKDIEYIEKVVAAYEKKGIDQKFDSLIQEKVIEDKKREMETKQSYDRWEKEQLNKDKTSLIKSIKSLFIKIFRAVIEKLQFKKGLIEYENPKEQKGSFVSYLPSKSLDELTNFGFEVEKSNPEDQMDVKSTKLDQVTTDKKVDEELGKKA